MPLLKGSSPEIQDENTQELLQAGHPEDQAVAIAYHASTKGAKVKSLKRPSLHPLHPFNNAKAPDNMKRAFASPVAKPMAPMAPMKPMAPMPIAQKVMSAMPKPFTSFARMAPKAGL